MLTLAIILCTILLFIKVSFQVAWPFLLMVFIYIIGDMIYRYKKYGVHDFGVFQKREKINANIEVLKKIILESDSDASFFLFSEMDLVALTSFGCYAFSFFEKKGIHIEGNVSEKTLTYWKFVSKKKKGRNPFYIQKNLLSNFSDIPIQSYVISDDLSILNVKGKQSSKLIHMNAIYYELEKAKKETSSFPKEKYQKLLEGCDLWQLPKQNS